MIQHTASIAAPVNIGGYALYAGQAGSGTPAVIFEAGLGSCALQWHMIQAAVAEFAHTLSYDRAGAGRSDASPYPRTPEQLTDDLHRLLEKLNIAPPYILVGHSFGGLIGRFYAKRYPGEVAGLVLVDASHEQQLEILPNYWQRHNTALRVLRVMSLLARFIPVGRLSAAQTLKSIREQIPPDIWQQLISLTGSSKHLAGLHAEMLQFPDFFGAAHRIPDDFGDLPLVVVTAADSLLYQGAQGNLSAAELNAAHQQNQAALARMSTTAQHIVVPGASHLSLMFHPVHRQYVIDAIRGLIRV